MNELLYHLTAAVYLGPVLLAPAVLIFLAAAMTRKGRKAELPGNKLLYWLGATAMLGLLFGVCAVLISLSSYHPAAERMICGGAFLLIDILLAVLIFRTWKRRWTRVAFLSPILAWGVAAGSFYAWQAWDETVLRIDDSYYELGEYIPYGEDSRCAELDEPAAFAFTGTTKMDGATALYPVYAAFAKATYPEGALDDSSPYREDNPVCCTTTAEAYRALAEGWRDVIFAAGASEEQIEYARSLGEEMVFTPIGREAFVFFVNAQNPVDNLTVDQLRGIYSGGITDWKELGAHSGAIHAFQREEGSGSQTRLVRFMGDTPLMEAPREHVSGGMGDIVEMTADYRNYRNAIGYSFRFYTTEMVTADQIRLLSVNGVEPTAENIADGSYPISGEFYAVRLRSNENPEIDRFIEWILSEQGQELIEKTGYVRLNP